MDSWGNFKEVSEGNEEVSETVIKAFHIAKILSELSLCPTL
jgi:hypothetical protein